MARSAARRLAEAACLLPLLLGAATVAGHAQNRKPPPSEVAAIHDCAKNTQPISTRGNGGACSIWSRRRARKSRKASPTSASRIAIASKGQSGTICSMRITRISSPISMMGKRQSCATCSAPGSPTAIAPAVSTTRRFKERWRSRWKRPAWRARPPDAHCCSSFLAVCRGPALDQPGRAMRGDRAASGRCVVD
jgi:hypothetical protein